MKHPTFFVVLFLAISSAWAREEISLDQGWKFLRSDANGAADISFDDSSWQSVDLPHTWNASDATGGVNTYYRGVGWYRRHIKLTPDQTDLKQIYLWFGAAGSAAEVYVNGQPAGSHKGAFGAFCFDIRPLVTTGDNVVAVHVTNAQDETIAPLSGDFNMQGGLYRNAKLLVLESVAISPMDSASSGVYVKQTKVTDDSAELEITTLLRNIEPAEMEATVICAITDASGAAVATESSPTKFTFGRLSPVVQKITINKPHLWNGRLDPYLYNVNVEVFESNRVVDRVTIPTGLRYYRVDPEQGFFLNGKHYDLHGVNRHQDFAGKGWAITINEMQTDIDLIKELGCTMLRLAHYEHSPLFYELCDKNGLIIWAELCLVNQVGHVQGFDEVTKQQLTDLIKQNYNHPSICFWSMYNELGFSGGDKDVQFIRDLNAQAHELDPTRLTTAAANRPLEHAGNWVTDVVDFNRYYGWYSGGPEQWPGAIDAQHAFKPSFATGFSEYGAGANTKQHELNPKQSVPTGKWHPEEWQNIVHEQAYKAMAARPYLWSKLLWNFADFGAAPRKEGDSIGMNDKGLVTFDRKTKKDAFYFYKSNWSDEPTVYITSRRFTPRPQQVTYIKIYSNCDSVELKVNGQSLGSKSSPDHVLVWEEVNLKPGDNRIEAAGAGGGKPASDACTIVQDPTAATQPGL